MPTIEVYFQIGHPHRFDVPREKIEREVGKRLSRLAGSPVRLGTVVRGNTSTLCQLVLEMDKESKIPDDRTVINEMAQCLIIERGFGATSRWTFLGWECWYTGMKWSPLQWGLEGG